MIATTGRIRKQVLNNNACCSATILYMNLIAHCINSGSKTIVIIRCLLRVIARLPLIPVATKRLVPRRAIIIVLFCCQHLLRSAVLRYMKRPQRFALTTWLPGD